MTRFQTILGGAAGALGIALAFGGAGRWLLAALVCGLAGLWIGLGVCYPRWQMFGTSLNRVRTGKKVVVLTFDDGPDCENTPALLELLRKRGIRATFFCVGHRVTQHPELVRRMTMEGHQIENHSYAHSPWTNLFLLERLRTDLTRAQEEIETTTGRRPLFFRPPMNLTNPQVFRVARDLGLQVTGYTARGLDRRAVRPDQIVSRLLRGVKPGAILQLHDAGIPKDRLLEVVTGLLDRLERAGYECLRLDEAVAGQSRVNPNLISECW